LKGIRSLLLIFFYFLQENDGIDWKQYLGFIIWIQIHPYTQNGIYFITNLKSALRLILYYAFRIFFKANFKNNVKIKLIIIAYSRTWLQRFLRDYTNPFVITVRSFNLERLCSKVTISDQKSRVKFVRYNRDRYNRGRLYFE